MAILIIAEHDNSSLKLDTAKLVACGLKIGNELDILLIGHQCDTAVLAAQQLNGVRQVLVADAPEYAYGCADNVAKLVVSLAKEYEHVICAASSQGKDILPRIAALLDVAQISDVVEVISSDTFVRPIYAGSALATIQSLDDKKVMTVRCSAFDCVESIEDSAAARVIVDNAIDSVCEFVSQSVTQSVRPELGAARVVISGGRALGSRENFIMLEQLADKLGGAVGASRAAVDAGYVSNDLQVGQTGKIVAPDLYVAIGISGAIQHLAGMKGSKVIVAINKDPDAPIFQIADYGLEADLFEAVPELLALLENAI